MKASIPGLMISKAFVVPREALYEQQFVFVVEDDRLSYRTVQIARRQPDYVIVNDGLHDGDLLVVEMLQGVTPGMLARPKQQTRKDAD
jgi:multidrug efflux pump subunit AcrA (membrane-fusion protein)